MFTYAYNALITWLLSEHVLTPHTQSFLQVAIVTCSNTSRNLPISSVAHKSLLQLKWVVMVIAK